MLLYGSSTNIFKFRVSIRVMVKLDYIKFDSVILKVLLTRLTPGVYMHLYMVM